MAEPDRYAVPRNEGRFAVPRDAEDKKGKGRGTPDEEHLPMARHLGIEIFVGEGDASTDTVQAKDRVIDLWNLWVKEKGNARYRIVEIRFDFVTENKCVLYVIYSK